MNGFGGEPMTAGPERQKKFTLIGLLVMSSVIAILSALSVPALTSSLAKAQATGTMNNARQLYLAQFSMANDGAATGNANLTWPGDRTPAFGTLEAYVNTLVDGGYLRGADIAKLLNAPGCNLTVTVASSPPETVTFTGGIAALKVQPLRDVDPPNTVFCTTRNYDYDTALLRTSVPYGTRSFVVMHKGGDGSVFKTSQATLAGWGGLGHEIEFQKGVGAKTGEAVGTVTPGDPAGTLKFP
jgi:type II secretory pathway pseudopilin PulG